MAGLHQCSACGWRFETAAALREHEDFDGRCKNDDD